MSRATGVVGVLGLLGGVALVGCGGGESSGAEGSFGGSGNGTGTGGSAAQGTGGSAASGTGGSAASGTGGGGGTIAFDGGGDTGAEDCGNTLTATVRDFTASHPDFQSYSGAVTGLVLPDLGADRKPAYAHAGGTSVTTGPGEFAQWYNDVAGVNQRLSTQIVFTEPTPGTFLYDNSSFFPIDGQGWGDGPDPAHNFLFTTEVHVRFTYRGGEVFSFRGDDDLWIFINGKLAMDLGGVHGAMDGTADIDALAAQLGIRVGETYPMDIFHAERHTTESNFRIETTIDCFTTVVVE